MEKVVRREFTDEFKEEAVKLVRGQGLHHYRDGQEFWYSLHASSPVGQRQVIEFSPCNGQHDGTTSGSKAVAARE